MNESKAKPANPQSPPDSESDAGSVDDAFRYLTLDRIMPADVAIYELNQKLAQGLLRLHYRRTDSPGLGQEGDVPAVSWQSGMLRVSRDFNRNEVDWAIGETTAKNDGRAFVATCVPEDKNPVDETCNEEHPHTYELTVSMRDMRSIRWLTPPHPDAASAPTEPTYSGDSPEEARTRKFLTNLMREDSANAARHSKADLKVKCQEQCGEISARAFEQIWAACVDVTGAVAYERSGPRGPQTTKRRPK